MQVDDKKAEQIINKLESAINSIAGIDIWLPQAIHSALDKPMSVRDDIDRMIKEKKEDEKMHAEINNLSDQLEESKKQTREVKKQAKYLFWAFVCTLISLATNIFLQLVAFFTKKP